MNTDVTVADNRGYGLSLSDGSRWWISGVKENAPWMDKLGRIMELSESAMDGSPKLFFSKIRDTNDALSSEGYTLEKLLPGRRTEWNLWERKTIRIWWREEIDDVICEINNDEGEEIEHINMWFACLPIYQRSIKLGGLPIHAALVELSGRGVLLAASGDTGKSTCCRRIPEPWKPLCDDETLVVLSPHKKYRAHPFPTWSDYLWQHAENTWSVQYSVPLEAIFFLEQSKTDEVIPVGEGEAAVFLNESATQVCEKFWRKMDGEFQRKFRRQLFLNACQIAHCIPAFRLRVSLHGRFWEKMCRTIC
jgi:SynChlorMet cassette protein ScmC